MKISLRTIWVTCQIIHSSLGAGNVTLISPALLSRLKEFTEDEDFNWLFIDIASKIRENMNCVTILTDQIYEDLLSTDFFRVYDSIPMFKVLIKDYEDLLSPNYNTLEIIRQARSKGCNAYIILVANGGQVARFLQFGDKNRVVDTRAMYLILHDWRLFSKEISYVWKKLINVLFIRKLPKSLRYELSTVPFPTPFEGIFRPLRLDTWRAGKFQDNRDLFPDKTSNLQGEQLRVATFQHMPSVVHVLKSSKKTDEPENEGNGEDTVVYSGLEINILRSLSEAMNFRAVFYEPLNADTEAWGVLQLNGTYSGLLGEVISGKADFVLGNFLYSPYNLKLMDLSRPYITECFTFLTPESTTDNSWKTLIAPFKLYMWVALLVTLVVATFVFFVLAQFQNLLDYERRQVGSGGGSNLWLKMKRQWWTKKKDSSAEKQLSKRIILPLVKVEKPIGLYLFDTIDNSFMNSYSMLLLVSLTKMPTGWSLRVMTGWWYIYCILVTVAYRASMTAILANPPQKVTIDTLEELAASPISCGGWGEQNKELFTTSLDSAGQQVGKKFQIVNDMEEGISRVTDGRFAYYENIYFLHHAKVKKKLDMMNNQNMTANGTADSESGISNRDLHIMGDCAINVPVSVGLQKNSPLKPRVDIFIQRVIEAGLIKKWLQDVMFQTTSIEAPLGKVEVKALMDLKKFQGALVALGIGYILSISALLIEIIYWNRFIKKNPLFDKYFMDVYFNKR